MRRIDLFCKLLGPLTISLVAVASNSVAIWTTIGMNSISLPIEYFAIRNVYRKFPALARDEQFSDIQDPETTGSTGGLWIWLQETMRTIVPVKSMTLYFCHPTFIPSFSLSLLYLTVLSFSGQLITYLISVGYTPAYVGAARTLSTIFELSATWIAPRLIELIGSVRGGIWGLSWQMIWLGGGTLWFFGHSSEDSMIPATGLAVGVAISRIGLWSYDLCAQNIIQDVSRGETPKIWLIDRRKSVKAIAARFRLQRLHFKMSSRCSHTRRRLYFRIQVSSSIQS